MDPGPTGIPVFAQVGTTLDDSLRIVPVDPSQYHHDKYTIRQQIDQESRKDAPVHHVHDPIGIVRGIPQSDVCAEVVTETNRYLINHESIFDMKRNLRYPLPDGELKLTPGSTFTLPGFFESTKIKYVTQKANVVDFESPNTNWWPAHELGVNPHAFHEINALQDIVEKQTRLFFNKNGLMVGYTLDGAPVGTLEYHLISRAPGTHFGLETLKSAARNPTYGNEVLFETDDGTQFYCADGVITNQTTGEQYKIYRGMTVDCEIGKPVSFSTQDGSTVELPKISFLEIPLDHPGVLTEPLLVKDVNTNALAHGRLQNGPTAQRDFR